VRARVLTLARGLAARFHAASAREPLDALPPAAAAELAALLTQVEDFEDLPGKWQAALLAAEGGPGASGVQGCHCG
jgi:hypothetical protein